MYSFHQYLIIERQMVRCCMPFCKCTLTLKIFLTAVVLYLLISFSLMIPSFRDYASFQSKIDALEHTDSQIYECSQICVSYDYFREPNLCCSSPQLGNCFTKDQCKQRELDDLKNGEKSALMDIQIGVGITIFWLMVLIIIFRKKYSNLVHQEIQHRQNFNNFGLAQENRINESLLKSRGSTSVYRSFVDEERHEQMCVICYQQLTCQKIIRLTCKHEFHNECIRQWLQKKSQCPVCRSFA